MIILIKYNNTSSKYLPTYQFLGTIGRQVLHLVPSKLAFHNDGLVLAGKTFPFLHTGKIFQKRLFLVGFFFTPWEILMFSLRGYILAFTLAKCSWPLSLLTLLVEISLPRLNISGKKKSFCLPTIPTQPKQYKVSTYRYRYSCLYL